MRVIAGEYRSRRLKSLPGRALRPTPDRLREALFSVLAPRIPGCTFVDAYAGCGAVGIEALSRGAGRVYFIESHRAAAHVIEENLKALGAEARAAVIRGRAPQHLGRLKADIVFLDPPYDLAGEYAASLRILGRTCPPLVLAQHSARVELEEAYGGLRRVRELRQGDNVVTMYEAGSAVEGVPGA